MVSHKNLLKSIFYSLIAKLGVYRIFYWINRHKKITLAYHNIIPDYLFDSSVHLGMSHCESVFEKQLQHIKKRFHANKIEITFDDGYKNQCEIAAKILEKHGLKGVFFISFKMLNDKKPLAIEKLTQWVSYVPAGRYHVFDSEMMISENNRFEIGSQLYEKLISNYALWDVVECELDHAYPFSLLKINPLLDQLRFTPMTQADLTELKRNGHTIGSHGWSHFPLAALPLENQRDDFLCSENARKNFCNSSLYSYPYGGENEVAAITINLCQEYGFSAAYSNKEYLLWPRENIRYQLPRITLPNNDNLNMLDAKLSGFEFFCKSAVRKVKQQLSK